MKNKDVIDMGRKTIDTIKILGLDMINAAGSGHPGIVLGAAPIMYTLFMNHLNIKPDIPDWANRDRFILSAGHGSALLYSTMFLAGYNINQEELKTFRQIDSILPGHPEYGVTPGVEMSTGPLGQGIASAVGMALSERYLSSVLQEDVPKQQVIDHYVYVLCGDGDLMEGISYEAASFAGTQKLNKLIVLYDSNNISLDESTSVTFQENVLGRFQAMGWDVQLVKDGTNTKEIDKAITRAKKTNTPSIIEIKTIIGAGSREAGKSSVHGKPLSEEDFEQLRSNASVKEVPFGVSKDVLVHFRGNINKRVEPVYNKWVEHMSNLRTIGNEYAKRMVAFMEQDVLRFDFKVDDLKVADNYIDELRNGNNKILNMVAGKIPFILGGSADLSSSCKTNISDSQIMTALTPNQKNIYFGVREHAMGAILNGMALYGLRVFGSTFLTFSDYLKPSIRLSCLMDLPVTYIFTHDTVAIGEDGATHQPVEQLGALRSIPNLFVYRPCDINEVMASWNAILKDRSPSCLIISKQKCSLIPTSSKNISKGAYIIKGEISPLKAVIISTGTEVHTSIQIANELEQEGIGVRVISAPCLKTFDLAGGNYKNELMPLGIPVFSIEASNDSIWYKYVTNPKYCFKIDDFGYSGKANDILEKVGFTVPILKDKIRTYLNND